ncbi:MAG: Abi family protein [Fibrobacter sp.]|nr:Abi family protein [Fibrobacter sp.]
MSSKRTFSKVAISIPEQIELLKSRGLEIPSEEKAQKFLSVVSYYRLSAYSYYYEHKNNDKSRSHRFFEGITFSDITALYTFDSKLRRLFWEAIEQIEIAFRTSLTYHLSLKYGSHWYLNNNLFLPKFNHDDFISKLKAESGFGKPDTDKKRLAGEDFINHYYTNYSVPELPPSWMVTEIIPLGRLSHLYSSLAKRVDQKPVAHDFGLDFNVFISWIRSLSYLRNLCAHYCRIWNRAYNINKPANSKKLEIYFGSQNRIYSFFVICAFLQNKINPNTQWIEKVLGLLDQYSKIPRGSMGFYTGWKDEPVWEKLLNLDLKKFNNKI